MEILKNQVQIDRGNSFYESNQPYSLFLLIIFFSIYHKCAKFHRVQKKGRASIRKLARFSSSNYGHYIWITNTSDEFQLKFPKLSRVQPSLAELRRVELSRAESSRAKLGHSNFQAEMELTICTSLKSNFFKFPNFAPVHQAYCTYHN